MTPNRIDVPTQVGETFSVTEVSRETVIARLEVILPRLQCLVSERSAAARSHRDAIWTRAYPDREPVSASLACNLAALHVDYVLEHANALGANVGSMKLGEDFLGLDELDELARVVLRELPTLDEDVFVVSDSERCFRVHAARLTDFVLREVTVTGESSFDGDEIFICTESARVVVLHHEGWVFDVECR